MTLNTLSPNDQALSIFSKLQFDPVANAAIFNTMRILKKVNRADTYYENYLWHYEKRKDSFVDYYHLLWYVGSVLKPKMMLEIGCRTGISICQLLSSMMEYADREVHIFDIFDDDFISPELVKVNLKYLNIPTEIVYFHKGDSMVTIPEFKLQEKRLFDYILVDGSHERLNALNDLHNVKDMVAPGGVLIFDDIADDGCGLIDVWEQFTKECNDFYYSFNLDGKGVGIGVKRCT